MFKTKRKRAVVLALIAFFCTAATTYVAVDWRRVGGGFLAYFKGRSGQAVASGSGSSSGTRVDRTPTGTGSRPGPAALTHVAAADVSRHGGGGHKADDDLFKYGDPAAGGIPPGSFIVAQNETPGGNTNGGGAPAPASGGAPAAAEGAAPGSAGGGEGGTGGVGSPAPSPNGTGSIGDGGVITRKPPTPSPPAQTPPAPTPATPSPSPAPTTPVASPPATPTPPSPAPAPIQSGSTSDPGGDTGSGGSGGGNTTPVSSPGTVSAVPEASNLAMMSLGALFLAVAATRKRKND